MFGFIRNRARGILFPPVKNEHTFLECSDKSDSESPKRWSSLNNNSLTGRRGGFSLFMKHAIFCHLQPLKTGLKKSSGADGSGRGGGAQASDRSEGPHNIFRPDSALSQSDDELEDIEESLSQSINKLQNLQSQLSGINKNNSEAQSPSPSAEVLNSNRSSDTTPRNVSAGPTPRNLSAGPTPRDFSARSASKNLATSNDLQVNGLANNMTSQGLKQKAKASLSSIENSYQNIKHKTPVNQVRTVSSAASASGSQVCHWGVLLCACLHFRVHDLWGRRGAFVCVVRVIVCLW